MSLTEAALVIAIVKAARTLCTDVVVAEIECTEEQALREAVKKYEEFLFCQGFTGSMKP